MTGGDRVRGIQEGGAAMPAVTPARALELMAQEVRERFGADEVLEVYNELFPRDRRTGEHAPDGSVPLVQRLVDHINSRVELDEIMELWRLIFLNYRNVWYNEIDDQIEYTEEEAVPTE
jgi:hypothetical protein